jgi:hypothetical protein
MGEALSSSDEIIDSIKNAAGIILGGLGKPQNANFSLVWTF